MVHLTTLLAAAGTITTMTNAMPFSESKSFASLQSLQSRDGLSAATSSTDIAALDVPQTQERRQQVLELPKAALANSTLTTRGETSRKVSVCAFFLAFSLSLRRRMIVEIRG